MKSISRLTAIIVYFLSAVLLAGCSGKNNADMEIPEYLRQAPDKLVKQFMSDIQFQNIEKLDLYFSKEIPEKTRKSVGSIITGRKRIGRYETDLRTPVDGSREGQTVLVQLIYSFTDPEAAYGASKKTVEKTAVKLKLENGLWKIRTLGMREIDELIENDVFLDCLDAVMDATIAQEKVRFNKTSYASSIADLMKVYNINEMACDELTIEDAGAESYLLVAKTRNTVSCLITADTDSHKPESYEDCNSPLPTPKTAPAASATATQAVK